jgi:hypothetical protein
MPESGYLDKIDEPIDSIAKATLVATSVTGVPWRRRIVDSWELAFGSNASLIPSEVVAWTLLTHKSFYVWIPNQMEHTSVYLCGNDLSNLKDAMGGCVLSVKKIDDQLYRTRRHYLQPKEGLKCCRHVTSGIHRLLPRAWYAEELQVSYIFYL